MIRPIVLLLGAYEFSMEYIYMYLESRKGKDREERDERERASKSGDT